MNEMKRGGTEKKTANNFQFYGAKGTEHDSDVPNLQKLPTDWIAVVVHCSSHASKCQYSPRWAHVTYHDHHHHRATIIIMMSKVVRTVGTNGATNGIANEHRQSWRILHKSESHHQHHQHHYCDVSIIMFSELRSNVIMKLRQHIAYNHKHNYTHH